MCNTDILIAKIEQAEHTLIVYIDGFISAEILNSCLTSIQKGLSLDLFLNAVNESFLETNLFLLNKCIQLVNQGGSIFMITNAENSESWKCITDFNELAYYSSAEQKVFHERIWGNSLSENILLDFERKKQENKPYLIENGDLQIKFNASEQLIQSGDSIELKWEVKGADKVIIQGLGEVEAFGRKKIILTKDTILKIGASNEQQSQIKTILIRVSETTPEIQYDIGFISAATKQYISLVNSDIHPHVYGISKGNQVKLTWKVLQAQSVTIMPFNLMETSGEYYFTPESSLTIEIQATIGNNILTRKIQVLLFPVPLFKEKLFSFDFFKNKKQTVPILVLFAGKIKEMKEEENQRYLSLSKKITNQHLLISSKKFNLKAINIFLLEILKERYSHRKGILQQINSIRSYYDQPSTGKGTHDRSH